MSRAPREPQPLPFGLRLKVRDAARVVREGGVIAYPTEAVYGLGCLPNDPHAVGRIVALKRRSARKGLLLIGATLEQIEAFARLDASPLRDEILSSWPGPFTWVLPARPGTLDTVTGGRPTVAVRITDHPVARALCRHAGSALVSTSANVAGRPPLRTALGVRRHLGAAVDAIVPGPLGGRAAPSRIRCGMTGRVLRG